MSDLQLVLNGNKLLNRRARLWKVHSGWVILLMVVTTIAVSAPIYYRRIIVPVDTDYGSHIAVADQWLRGEVFIFGHLSHRVLQILLIGLRLLSGLRFNLYEALIFLQVAVQVVIVLILYVWFGQSHKPGWNYLRAFAAVSLTFVAPIMLLAPLDGLYYFGYIGLANYHNPTIHLLKPAALISILFAIQAITGKKSTHWQVVASAVIVILSAGIKPSYALSILPALGISVAIRWLQKKSVDVRMLAGGLFLPAVLVLAAQWLVTYQFGDPAGHIILAPLLVESSFSGYLLPKFLLSAAFPLVIIFIARRRFLENSTLLIGWSGFLAGIAQMYLLAEGGDRLLHGNFRWSAQIMLFLLFAISMRWLLRNGWAADGISRAQKAAAWAAFLAHLGGGVAYYIYCMVSVHYR